MANTKKRLIMIMGVQRSGTTALFETLATAPGLTSYHEHLDDAVYRDYYLRPEPEIRSVLEEAPGAVLLKPVRESERRGVQAVFDEYAAYDLHIIWLYRDPVNVLYSYERKGWSSPPHFPALALEWVERNQAMLEVSRAYKGRLMIVRYEDLLQNPALLTDLTSLLGLQVQSTLHADSNAGRAKVPQELQTVIDQIACRTLTLLDQERTLRPTPENVPTPPSLFARILQRFGMKGQTRSFVAKQPNSSRENLLALPGEDAFLDQPDLFTLLFRNDPYTCFRHWRRSGSVHFLPSQNRWLLLGYDDVASALVDQERFTAPPDARSDPPENAEWKPVLDAFYTPENCLAQSEKIAPDIRCLLCASSEGGAFDWIEFCQRITPPLFADLLGVLPESSERFFELVNQQAELEILRTTLDDAGVLAQLIDVGPSSREGLSEFILTASFFRYLIVSTLGNILYQLLQQPQWRAEARLHPTLVPAMTTELLRRLPLIMILRTTRGDVVMDDVTLAAGSYVYLALGSANRDPGVFERPDELRLDREGAPIVTFGLGANYCWRMGEHTARVISESVLRVLLTEFPPLEATQPLTSISLSYEMFAVSGPLTLPVKFATE